MNAPARVEDSTSASRLVALRADLGSGFTKSLTSMMVVDGQSRPVIFNRAAEAMFGSGHASTLAGSVQQLLHEAWPCGIPGNPNERSDPYRTIHDTELLSPPGQHRLFELVVEAIDSRTGNAWFMVQVRDLTTQRQQQVELAFTHMRYQQLGWELPDDAVCIFDTDLRTLLVGRHHEPEPTNDAAARRRLSEIIPSRALEQLGVTFQASWVGPATAFRYSDPRQSRGVRVRVQPIAGLDGTALGFLATSESSELDRRPASRPHRGMVTVGDASYDQRTGWAFDDGLLLMWGVEHGEVGARFLDNLILEDDRVGAWAAWDEVLTRGGQCTVAYRIRHGHTGALVHLVCTLEAILDPAGRLFRARATHMDVTHNVVARDLARTVVAEAVNERTAAVRDAGKALTAAGASLEEVAQTMVDIAVSMVGDGALVQILRPGSEEVDLARVAHRKPSQLAQLEKVTDRTTMNSPVVSPDFLKGARLLSNVRPEPDQQDILADLVSRVDNGIRYFIVAPVRHRGEVFAVLTLFRSHPATPYLQQDEELVNAVVQRLKPSLIEGQAMHLVQRERAEREAATERLREAASAQTELLGQLANTASRERTLLAEAVHNDPLQLIVAALLRIDLLNDGLVEDGGVELEGVARLLESSVHKLRHLIVGLAPPDLHDGLGGALLRLADGLFAGTMTTVGSSGPKYLPLEAEVADAAFQILREALINVRKHASARSVFVRTQTGHGEVSISISDDGIGSHTLDAGPGHLGLSMMRAQATAQGGRLTIDSSPGSGTDIELTFPERSNT